jgi:hypothetical protein
MYIGGGIPYAIIGGILGGIAICGVNKEQSDKE